jgi:hypothetical protein
LPDLDDLIGFEVFTGHELRLGAPVPVPERGYAGISALAAPV